MTCACAATHTHRTKNLQQDEAGSAAAAEEGSKREGERWEERGRKQGRECVIEWGRKQLKL